jgi:ribonuclease HII
LTELTGVPLLEIRRRLEAARSPLTRRRIAAQLRGDARRGARALGASVEQRERQRRTERARLSKLFRRRNRLFRDGSEFVAGVDEVGVGPLAGPIVAAAVIFPRRVDYDALHGLDDSKRLTRRARERLAQVIRANALAFHIAEISADQVDLLNTYHAALAAMREAVAGLSVTPDHVLVDARTIPELEAPQSGLIHGDAIDASIAAASVVAKVHRDALMSSLHTRYPGYGFDRHVGYGTPEHLAALNRLGPSPVHRRSFAPVSRAIVR